jgi:hypothetical protein
LDDIQIRVESKSNEMSEKKYDGEIMMTGDDMMYDDESSKDDDEDSVKRASCKLIWEWETIQFKCIAIYIEKTYYNCWMIYDYTITW